MALFYFGWGLVFLYWLYYIYESFYAFRIKNVGRLLVASSFLLPFYSLSFSLFVQVSIHKIIVLPLIVYWVLYGDKKLDMSSVALILYLIFVTVINLFIVVDGDLFSVALENGRAELRAYFSWFVSLSFDLLTFSVIFFLSRVGVSQDDALKALKFFVYGCVVAVFLGWIQLCFYYYNIDWFSFWFLTDVLGRADYGKDVTVNQLSQVSFRGETIHRMSGLSGEPRHLAAFLVVALFVSIFLKRYNKFSNYHIVIVVLLLGILLTQSTSALLALFVGAGVYVLFNFSRITLFSLLLAGFLVALVVPFDMFGLLLWKAQSWGMANYAAPKDSFAFKAVTDDLFRFIFGYGAGLADIQAADLYLYQETPFGMKDRSGFGFTAIIQPTSFVLRMLLQYGVFGVMLIFYFLYRNYFIFSGYYVGMFMVIVISFSIFGSTLIANTGVIMAALMLTAFGEKKKPKLKCEKHIVN